MQIQLLFSAKNVNQALKLCYSHQIYNYTLLYDSFRTVQLFNFGRIKFCALAVKVIHC